MKKQLETFTDIQLMVRSFYNKVLKDELLRHYFEYVYTHHWEKHLELLDQFWNNVIFYTGTFNGNPLEKHKKLHQFKPLEKKVFDRWLELFRQTVDERFEGQNAERAKQMAFSIATVMQIKILTNGEQEAPLPGDGGKKTLN